MLIWNNFLQIKEELEIAISNNKCLSVPLIEKCKHRSNFIMHKMMKKRRYKVYEYLEMLEYMCLLEWCNHFSHGLLSNQII